jgi:hypothetical protein
MNIRIWLIAVLAAMLSACMTTSDISSLGNNTYAVSTLACPACGGTNKAENMAVEAANEFCQEQGKIAVTENIDIDSWDWNGAGTTDLAFQCVTPVSEDQVLACAQKHIGIATDKYGNEITQKIRDKLFSDENGFGFSELSDQALPTADEREVILAFGTGYEECEELRLSAVSAADGRVIRSSDRKRMSIMAKLSAAQITYGNYAEQSNEIDEGLYAALSELEKEAMQKRRIAAKESSEKLSRALDSNKPINCTSNVIGSSVYTNCN